VRVRFHVRVLRDLLQSKRRLSPFIHIKQQEVSEERDCTGWREEGIKECASLIS